MAPREQNSAVKTELGRRYHFSASHRLHNPRSARKKTAASMENAIIPMATGTTMFWKSSCSGEVDPATGMIANLADLDGFVEREVLEPFDHKSLNEDVAAFRSIVPTTENLCIEIFRRLQAVSQCEARTHARSGNVQQQFRVRRRQSSKDSRGKPIMAKPTEEIILNEEKPLDAKQDCLPRPRNHQAGWGRSRIARASQNAGTLRKGSEIPDQRLSAKRGKYSEWRHLQRLLTTKWS